MKYIVQFEDGKYVQLINGYQNVDMTNDINYATIFDENDDYDELVNNILFLHSPIQVEILDPFTAQYHLTDLVNL